MHQFYWYKVVISMCYFSSAVYVEGDIETRVYSDSVNDQVKNIPEICLRRDGMLISIQVSAILFCIFPVTSLYCKMTGNEVSMLTMFYWK